MVNSNNIAVVFFGPPLSGKDTQANELRNLDFDLVNSGELLRQKNIKTELISQGRLVEDEEIIDLVYANIPTHQCLSIKSRLVFNGFPRTKRQAEWLWETLAADNLVSAQSYSI